MKDSLINLYDKLNILNVPLHQVCPKCSVCWPDGDENEKKPQSSDELFIYTPWIGKEYNSLRLLVLGINMNQDSGPGKLSKQEEYVIKAKNQILEGKQRILRDSNYKGTIYWHRLPSYIAILLEKNNLISLNWSDEFPSKEQISIAFEYAAITNIIKCSPNQDNGRGTPNTEMWSSCSEFILKEELKILLPDQILILGLENYTHFKTNVCDFLPVETAGNESFKTGKAIVNGKGIKYYIIVHPTARGENAGSRRELMLEFNEFLYKNQIENLRVGLAKIAEKYLLNLGFFDIPLGRGESGFHFYSDTWKEKVSVGFGFDESWGHDLFYGIYKREFIHNTKVVDEIRVLYKLKNGINQSDNFPIWFWLYENENRAKNIISTMDVNILLIDIEAKLVQMLSKIQEVHIGLI